MYAGVRLSNHVLRSRNAYPSPNPARPTIASAKGSFLRDMKGREYFDAASGSGAMILGHGDEQMVQTLASHASSLTVFPGRQMASEIVETYMERLVAFAGLPDGEAITYSSGTDAVEAAMKLAIHYQAVLGRPQKHKIIGREGSYHGNSLGALSAGGFLLRRRNFEAALSAVSKAPSAQCSQCAFGLQPTACNLECATTIEQVLDREGAETVAAIIVEPVTGAAGGVGIPHRDYLAALREICDRRDVLLIYDEVMTGFGRTGRNVGFQHWGAVPDIIALGKGMGAGYFPLSGVVASGRVSAVASGSSPAFQNGHTFGCSPLGCAVGLAVLDRLAADNLVDASRIKGEALLELLQPLRRNGVVADVRALGLMIGMSLELEPNETPLPPGALSEAFQLSAMAEGVLVFASSGSAGSDTGDHILLLPPLTASLDELSGMCTRLVDALPGFEASVSAMGGRANR